MAKPLDTLKAPPGVDRDTLYQEAVKLEREKKRKKEREKNQEEKFYGGLWRLGSASVVAVSGGFLIAKFPRIASFDAAGRIKTRPILAAVAAIGAFVTEDEASNVMEGVAAGFGLPFLSDWGGRVAGMIGS